MFIYSLLVVVAAVLTATTASEVRHREIMDSFMRPSSSGAMTSGSQALVAHSRKLSTNPIKPLSYLVQSTYSDSTCNIINTESIYTFGYCEEYLLPSSLSSTYVVITISATTTASLTMTVTPYTDSTCSTKDSSTSASTKTFDTSSCQSELSYSETYIKYVGTYASDTAKRPVSQMKSGVLSGGDLGSVDMYLTAAGCTSNDANELILKKTVLANTCITGAPDSTTGFYSEYTCDSGTTVTVSNDDGFGTMDDDYENTIGATLGGGYYATSSCLVKILPIPSSSWPSGKGSCSYTTIDSTQGYINTSCSFAPSIWHAIGNWAVGIFCFGLFICVLLFYRQHQSNKSKAQANAQALNNQPTSQYPVVMTVYAGAPAPMMAQTQMMYPPQQQQQMNPFQQQQQQPQYYPPAPQLPEAYPPVPQAYPSAPVQAYATDSAPPPPPLPPDY